MQKQHRDGVFEITLTHFQWVEVVSYPHSLYYLRIITYLTYICWEIDNFVIKSDIFRRFFICKNILKKLPCYHDNYFRHFMFGKYNGFVSKARVSACMYFLVKV
jgi:hypothetical protein